MAKLLPENYPPMVKFNLVILWSGEFEEILTEKRENQKRENQKLRRHRRGYRGFFERAQSCKEREREVRFKTELWEWFESSI